MPELPEVESVRSSLATPLTGQQFSNFDLFWDRTLEHPSLPEFRAALLDNAISSVERRGKFLMLVLRSSDRITIHLRMTGVLRYIAPEQTEDGDPESAYLRAQFEFASGGLLRFYDVRKFGRIKLLRPTEWARFNSALGVEPLSPRFTPEALTRLLLTRRRQLKPLLLDQRVVAGLGNIYVDEALFTAGIHPQTPSNRIPDAKMVALREAIVDVLSKAVENRGTTLRNYRDGFGEQGENQFSLRIYGKPAGEPCPRCSTPLIRMKVGQRGTVFCPSCQPLDPGATEKQR